ncbi:hypothetical protein [Mycoplasma suis]|uniref:hypothetical protein n=1 Tax=Mycoplasma suis TaxID=57372 RepID=UPI0013053631|nr:hypothetical protein [Mycoplasma suis]
MKEEVSWSLDLYFQESFCKVTAPILLPSSGFPSALAKGLIPTSKDPEEFFL